VKSDVENLSETRVKFTVELPFEELNSAIEEAYKRIATQVQIPGFRKGKVPHQIIDQRFGRGAVLEEVVNNTVPRAYDEAVKESGVFALGQPELEVTDIVDGERIAFVAEVDIRPDFDLPEYKGLRVEVDSLQVGDDDLAEQLDGLRKRFGSYTEVERPVESGDVLLIDTTAESDGAQIEELAQTAASYEVGEDGMIPGLDEAVQGRSAGESAGFEFTPEFGEYQGKPITVNVTVSAVRERSLPELDDDLAMMASEFDTLDELRADLRTRLERARLMERGTEARGKLHEMLVDSLDIPLPESLIAAEVNQHFENHGEVEEGHREEVEADARKSLKSQFLMDRIADTEDVGVGEQELSQWLMMQAPRYGMNPDQFAQALVEAGQVPMAVAEVRRGKALALVLQSAEIVDADGTPVDLRELDAMLADASATQSVEDLIEEIEADDDEIEADLEAQVEAAEEIEIVAEEAEVVGEAQTIADDADDTRK
jgi:trigger factor